MNAQTAEALRSANKAKRQLSAAKRRLAGLPRDEGLEAAMGLLSAPNGTGSLTVEGLLLAVRNVGLGLVEEWTVQAGVLSSKRLRELTVGERDRLVGVLRDRPPTSQQVAANTKTARRRVEAARLSPGWCSGCGAKLLEPTGVCGFCEGES